MRRPTLEDVYLALVDGDDAQPDDGDGSATAAEGDPS